MRLLTIDLAENCRLVSSGATSTINRDFRIEGELGAWQHLIGAAVFIGETDRLNTYLNMRLAEYAALRTYGRVPGWNPTMFGGFSVAALHWMNPGTDPIAFFLQLFPRDRVYQALGYVSIALVLAACAMAYFYVRDLT